MNYNLNYFQMKTSKPYKHIECKSFIRVFWCSYLLKYQFMLLLLATSHTCCNGLVNYQFIISQPGNCGSSAFSSRSIREQLFSFYEKKKPNSNFMVIGQRALRIYISYFTINYCMLQSTKYKYQVKSSRR